MAREVLSSNKQLSYSGFKPTYKILNDYSEFIRPSHGTTKVVSPNGDLSTTLKVIQRLIQEHKSELQKLAHHLKGDSLKQSAFNTWHFLVSNIKYRFDTVGKEEVRTPSRSWDDRHIGIDCEDYAIFAACLLLNMGYNPKMRVVAFNGNENFAHIFIVCDGVVIDPVYSVFGEEPPGVTKRKDMPTTFQQRPVYLNGIEGVLKMTPFTEALYRKLLALREDIKKNGSSEAKLRAERKLDYLVNLNGSEKQGPFHALFDMVVDVKGGELYFESEDHFTEFQAALYDLVRKQQPAEEAEADGYKMLIESDLNLNLSEREKAVLKQNALGQIEWAKKQKALCEFQAMNAIDQSRLSGFFSRVWDGVKKAADKVWDGVKKVANKVADVASDAWDNVKKIAGSPMRNAFLLLVKLNVFKMASKLAVGLLSKEAALSMGYTVTQWNIAVEATKKAEKFWKHIGGSISALHNNVHQGKSKGKAGKEYGFAGLGAEPVTTAGAAIAASSPIWGTILAFLTAVAPIAGAIILKDGPNEIDESDPSQYPVPPVTPTTTVNPGDGNSNLLGWGIAAAIGIVLINASKNN